MKLELAQGRELAAFAQFGSDLHKATQPQLDRFQRLPQLLKQPQYHPLSLAKEVMVIYAGTRGYIDHIGIGRIPEWEQKFYQFIHSSFPEVENAVEREKKLTPEIEESLKHAIDEFNKQFV
jgi:F-type H+-transporting ATPase subunit alpha